MVTGGTQTMKLTLLIFSTVPVKVRITAGMDTSTLWPTEIWSS